MEETVRGYILSNKAYYSQVVSRIEVIFGHFVFVDGHEEGTTGEMSIYWEELDGKMVPYLHCFDDGWKVLASFKDVLDAMAEVDNQCVTPDEFVAILDNCGFRDLTKYKSPYEN